MKTNALLHIRGLAIGHGREPLISGCSADLRAGELVALIGRNGAGKSTLLHTLGGLLRPMAGEVSIEGVQIHRMTAAERARHVAMVLSSRPLLPGSTVREVVAMGRHPWTGHWGVLQEADRERVTEAMRAADILAVADRPMDELSDGQRQQVMLARALAQTTRVLLLDEPTAHLDLVNQHLVHGLLRHVARERGALVVHATHDLAAACAMCDRIMLLPGDGSWSVGTPDELLTQGAVERAFGGILSAGFRRP